MKVDDLEIIKCGIESLLEWLRQEEELKRNRNDSL